MARNHIKPQRYRRQYIQAEGCNFIVLRFPSRRTHKMQALDVVVFAQNGRTWHEHCEECLPRGFIINRYNVVQNYLQVREKYMMERLIKMDSKGDLSS